MAKKKSIFDTCCTEMATFLSFAMQHALRMRINEIYFLLLGVILWAIFAIFGALPLSNWFSLESHHHFILRV